MKIEKKEKSKKRIGKQEEKREILYKKEARKERGNIKINKTDTSSRVILPNLFER